jgi:hypothetical protein
VATEKQIQANRRNAQRSTGPRSAAGKSISSRNAFQRGLSIAPEKDDAILHKINALASRISRDDPTDDRFAAAIDLSTVLLEIASIQDVRNEMLTTLDLKTVTPKQLWRLVNLDRYEARARTKRRRASARFRSC